MLILFFAWLLLHALMYSKSTTLIEGLEPSSTTTTPTTTTPITTTPPGPSQAQIDENTAEIAILKNQISILMQTAEQLKVTMIQNEVGIQNNTASIQKVVQSQIDMQAKMAKMKSAQ
jgi:hypothetical protein